MKFNQLNDFLKYLDKYSELEHFTRNLAKTNAEEFINIQNLSAILDRLSITAIPVFLKTFSHDLNINSPDELRDVLETLLINTDSKKRNLLVREFNFEKLTVEQFYYFNQFQPEITQNQSLALDNIEITNIETHDQIQTLFRFYQNNNPKDVVSKFLGDNDQDSVFVTENPVDNFNFLCDILIFCNEHYFYDLFKRINLPGHLKQLLSKENVKRLFNILEQGENYSILFRSLLDNSYYDRLAFAIEHLLSLPALPVPHADAYSNLLNDCEYDDVIAIINNYHSQDKNDIKTLMFNMLNFAQKSEQIKKILDAFRESHHELLIENITNFSAFTEGKFNYIIDLLHDGEINSLVLEDDENIDIEILKQLLKKATTSLKEKLLSPFIFSVIKISENLNYPLDKSLAKEPHLFEKYGLFFLDNNYIRPETACSLLLANDSQDVVKFFSELTKEKKLQLWQVILDYMDTSEKYLSLKKAEDFCFYILKDLLHSIVNIFNVFGNDHPLDTFPSFPLFKALTIAIVAPLASAYFAIQFLVGLLPALIGLAIHPFTNARKNDLNELYESVTGEVATEENVDAFSKKVEPVAQNRRLLNFFNPNQSQSQQLDDEDEERLRLLD